MLKMLSYCSFVLWFGVFGFVSSKAHAEGRVEFTLQANSHLLSGQLNNGSRIASGQMSYASEHLGFQVWSEAERSGNQPNSYILTGKNNSNNKVHIRLEQKNWMPDKTGGKGIILLDRGNRAVFDVVIDGRQTVIADNYSLMLKGAVILP